MPHREVGAFFGGSDIKFGDWVTAGSLRSRRNKKGGSSEQDT